MLALEKTDIVSMMPMARIVEALDDNGDGIEDTGAWVGVVATANERLADAFGTADVPPDFQQACRSALKYFVLELLYSRRGFAGQANPWDRQATAAEKQLRSLASGETAVVSTDDSGAVISTPARLAGMTGLIQ
jgi:hypothetical protein